MPSLISYLKYTVDVVHHGGFRSEALSIPSSQLLHLRNWVAGIIMVLHLVAVAPQLQHRQPVEHLPTPEMKRDERGHRAGAAV